MRRGSKLGMFVDNTIWQPLLPVFQTSFKAAPEPELNPQPEQLYGPYFDLSPELFFYPELGFMGPANTYNVPNWPNTSLIRPPSSTCRTALRARPQARSNDLSADFGTAEPNYSTKAKHVSFISTGCGERVQKGSQDVSWISTLAMPADGLTNPLATRSINALCSCWV